MPSAAVLRIITGGYVCPEARAFLARTTGLDGKHRRAYVALINGLVRDGVWSTLDVLYMFATQDSTTSLLNLVSSSFTATANSSPTFAADLGYTGTAASGTVNIDTGYNPSSAGLNYSQNSAHISLYSNTNAAAAGNTEMGLRTSGGTISQIVCRFTGNLALFNINDNVVNAAGIAVTASNGHYIATRSSSSQQNGYLNGIDQGVVGVTSSALTNGNIAILGRIVAPATKEVGSARQICCASIGGSLTGPQAINLYQRTRTYLQTIAGVA